MSVVSTYTALSSHSLHTAQGVSNTVALTNPGTILKKRVVANVRRGPGAAKSYLTSVLFASRNNVAGIPENCATNDGHSQEHMRSGTRAEGGTYEDLPRADEAVHVVVLHPGINRAGGV